MVVQAMKAALDVGTLFIRAVVLNPDGKTSLLCYRSHEGDRARALADVLDMLSPVGTIVATGTGMSPVECTLPYVDPVRALRAFASRFHPEARNIINVGFANVTLIELGRGDKLLRLSSNSLCAAGTGSFLDEQRVRLGLTYEDSAGLDFIEDPPTVAGRCAVFAKTDIVHKQQEGYSTAQLWAGLCRAVALTVLQTLCRGNPLRGPALLTGGVTLNREFVRRLSTLLPDGLIVPEHAHLARAVGAAISPIPVRRDNTSCGKGEDNKPLAQDPPLVLRRSTPPAFPAPEVDSLGNEVEILRSPDPGNRTFFLGIDIGSTSTKAVLVDERRRVAAAIYRRTLGDPVGAVKRIFSSLLLMGENGGTDLRILGCATTGAGRKLAGRLLGADLIVNEITAQAAGAVAEHPDARVVFEIGGQDSKFIRLDGRGRVADCNMNFVCASGTGSFVEEQARKLNFPLFEVSEIVRGIVPPRTTERCTVFMEQDLASLLAAGVSRPECMAAVCYGVVRNYLNKVVENRKIAGAQIVFQGATAKNSGLVAAFENLLETPVMVSRHCHVTGALGAAVLCMERAGQRAGQAGQRAGQAGQGQAPTTFVGLDLAGQDVGLRNETCRICTNHCTITHATIQGATRSSSWGYMCGREPDEPRARTSVHFSPFQSFRALQRQGDPGCRGEAASWKVGIPRALVHFTYLPLWQGFFGRLGAEVVVSDPTDDETVAHANVMAGADFCLPVKLFHGHLRQLLARTDLDLVFLPVVVSEAPVGQDIASYFCVYTQGASSLVRAAVEQSVDATAPKFWSPRIDFRAGLSFTVAELAKGLAKIRNTNPEAVKRAFRESADAFETLLERQKRIGREALDRLDKEDRIGIVLTGRPYTLHDDRINQKLPRKIAEKGYTVIPLECLPCGPRPAGTDEDPPLWFMYWRYGRDLTDALRFIAGHPRLYAVYLTNFNCGPDSFVLSYAQHIMGAKPMLTLQMDEHSADAGYVTRVEAFLDVIRGETAQSPPARFPKPAAPLKSLQGKRVWIPRIHPANAETLAAILRGYNMDARVLPLETRESHQTGLRVTRGSECSPMALTIGALLTTLRDHPTDPENTAYFMIRGTGPCLVGQYVPLQRMILDREGYGKIEIFAPGAFKDLDLYGQNLSRNVWQALLVGDLLFKMTCRVRPYEVTTGQADEAYRSGLEKLIHAFENRLPLRKFLREVAEDFADIRRDKGSKPLVGIVGDFYVRFNEYANESVIRSVERFGGEAWLSPMIESFFYFGRDGAPHGTKGLLSEIGRNLLERLGLFYLEAQERMFYRQLPLLADRLEPGIRQIEHEAALYLSPHARSEAVLNVGRSILFARQGAGLVAHCSPFGCMPGNLSVALFEKMQRDLGIPVVNLIYDGHGNQNRRLATYMENL